MPILQLTFLAIVAMTCLAALRLARVRFGRAPLPEGRGGLLFLAGFVFVPPLVVGVLAQPAGSTQLSWAIFVSVYVSLLAGVAFAMSTAAAFVGEFAHGRAAQVVRLALAGTDIDPDDVRSNPPLTARLAEIVAKVTAANAVFPRGPEFPKQSERPGFRGNWEALDGATTSLEGQIAADKQLGLGVAASAKTLAEDARSRLTMLRRAAGNDGHAWAQS